MKTIIDIPETPLYRDIYTAICENGYIFDEYNEYIAKTIKDGIPLDDIKAEIADEICLTNNPYTKETKYTIEHLKLLEILDNINNAGSEE